MAELNSENVAELRHADKISGIIRRIERFLYSFIPYNSKDYFNLIFLFHFYFNYASGFPNHKAVCINMALFDK